MWHFGQQKRAIVDRDKSDLKLEVSSRAVYRKERKKPNVWESRDQGNKIRTYSSAAIQTNVNENCRLSSTKCHAKGRKVHSANI